jgi:hypothetical protein
MINIAVHTLTSKSISINIDKTDGSQRGRFFGFNSKNDFFLGAKLSFLELKKKGYKVHLYTDLFGKSLLIDELKLNYDHVDVSHENLNLNPNLWSLSKLYTHKLQKEPYVHIDFDAFLFKDFSESFKSARIVCQNHEVGWDYYNLVWDSLNPYIRHKDKIMNRIVDVFLNKKPSHALNVGIFGGNDIPLIHSYCDSILSIVNSNLNLIPVSEQHHICIFAEQLYLYYYLYYKNVTPFSYMGLNTVRIEEFVDWDNYTHLAGPMKMGQNAIDMIIKKLECK